MGVWREKMDIYSSMLFLLFLWEQVAYTKHVPSGLLSLGSKFCKGFEPPGRPAFVQWGSAWGGPTSLQISASFFIIFFSNKVLCHYLISELVQHTVLFRGLSQIMKDD